MRKQTNVTMLCSILETGIGGANLFIRIVLGNARTENEHQDEFLHEQW